MYETNRPISEYDYSQNNMRVCASVLAKFWEEETLIQGTDEEEQNRDDVSGWLSDVALRLYEELEDSFTNFVNEGEGF